MKLIIILLLLLAMPIVATAEPYPISINEAQSYRNWNDSSWIANKDLQFGTDNYPYRFVENGTHWTFYRGTDVLTLPKIVIDVIHTSPEKISFEIKTTKAQIVNRSIANGTGKRYFVIPQSLLKTRFLFDNIIPDVCVEVWGNCSISNIFYSNMGGEIRLNFVTTDYLSLNSSDHINFIFNSYDVNASSTLNVDGGVYVVTQNFTCATTCLTIGANNLTLDLMGYTLTFANSSTGNGIANAGYDNVSVRNGTLLDAGREIINNRGIYWQSGANDGRIANMTISVFVLSGIGIFLTSSSNNTLTSNTGKSNSSYGIYLYSSSNNTLTSNTGTSNSSNGIYIYSSSNNNTLTSNTGTSNSSYGISLSLSSNNTTLTSNTGTSNSSYGIYLSSSSNNTLTSNTGTSNSSYGIYLSSSSNDNTLTSNTGTSNSSYGIYLYSSSNNTLNNNSVVSQLGKNYYLRDINYSRYNIFTDFGFNQTESVTFYDTASIHIQKNIVEMTTSVSTASKYFQRGVYSWTQSNLTWNENVSSTQILKYNFTMLKSNTNYSYSINGSALTYNLTDANGVLPELDISYLINYTTKIQILEVPNNYIPPASVWISNITGSYWANHTWQPGTGTVTNSYNVSNGSAWFNGTATYLNESLSPLAWSNVTVWAYNSSGTGTLSVSGISNNSQAPAGDLLPGTIISSRQIPRKIYWRN